LRDFEGEALFFSLQIAYLQIGRKDYWV
jgi:hypothetical protein